MIGTAHPQRRASVLGDAELVRAAQEGDAASLGTLLERHRAPLYALALGILGRGPEVQDASVVALNTIDRLREPEAVGRVVALRRAQPLLYAAEEGARAGRARRAPGSPPLGRSRALGGRVHRSTGGTRVGVDRTLGTPRGLAGDGDAALLRLLPLIRGDLGNPRRAGGDGEQPPEPGKGQAGRRPAPDRGTRARRGAPDLDVPGPLLHRGPRGAQPGTLRDAGERLL
jgi:hypothetical protein